MPAILTRELPLTKARVYFTGTIQLVDAVAFEPEHGQESPAASSVTVAESSVFVEEAFVFADENEAIITGTYIDRLGPDRSSAWSLIRYERNSFPVGTASTDSTNE